MASHAAEFNLKLRRAPSAVRGSRPDNHALYLAAMVGDPAGAHHGVFALSLKDGSPLQGWPVDVAEALAAKGQRFNTRRLCSAPPGVAPSVARVRRS